MSGDSSSMASGSLTTSTSSTSTSTPPLPTTPKPKPVRDDPEENEQLCRKWVESGMSKNTSIQFLLKTLIDLGCTPPDKFIRCVNCAQPAAGGFGMVVEESLGKNSTNAVAASSAANQTNSKEQCQRTLRDLQEQIEREQKGQSRLRLQPEIYVCQQYQESEVMTHRTVHHELIHAIDLCRTNADPLHNCVQMACTEIRAENLSGECGFWKEMPRIWKQSKFGGHGRECVRRRAVLSVRANPNCAQRAEEYVDMALPRCMQDYYPYDRHPNQR